MAIAGNLASVKASGTAVAFTDEATSSTDNLTFTINATSKRVWDFDTEVVVEVDGVEVSSGFRIVKLKGQVVFDTEETGTVIVSGSYLPLTVVGEAFSFDLNFDSNQVDASVFSTTWRRFVSTINGLSGSMSNYYINDYFFDTLDNNTLIVLEFLMGGATDPIKTFAYISADALSTSFDGLVEESVDFQGVGEPVL